ncbi:protein NRT1/ PTR FAMILY 1.2 isoform X2 [Cornus florida]|uniref:protein NRT1/ PTR FAMILY 1.2 isoform X2 n=1 Tax=Cornus florida TaxID=4283 RepID=UPI0028A1E377|nr:protein NRT1/ PTR FAMILY 1.2 isoform X2 [Cornus florida]
MPAHIALLYMRLYSCDIQLTLERDISVLCFCCENKFLLEIFSVETNSEKGMTLLWLTAMIPQLKPSPCDEFSYSCNSPSAAQLAVLYSSFGLISIGAGCLRPCSMAFGADQLDNKENPDNEKVLQSFFNWYYASSGISTVLAFTVILYIQDHLGWKVGFGVPAILMVFSVLMFLLGSSLYIKVKPSESVFTGFVQVIVVAFKNRNVSLPPSNSDGCYHQCHEKAQLRAPTKNLRFLNKACVITDCEGDLNSDGPASNPWRLCSVEKVESLKAFLRVIPTWSAGIMLSVSISQNSFPTLQANTMDRHIISKFEIPAGSFTVVMIVTLTVWIAFYDRVMVPLLAKYTGQPGGLTPKIRMGIGLLLSCVAMGLSGITESIRRGKAIEEGLEDDPDATVDMSAMWLVPQFALLGLAEAFNAIGQIEFFYSQFPKSMSSIAVALFTLGMAVSNVVSTLLVNIVDSVTTKGGKVSWLSKNLNKGHLDYYYWLLTFFGLVNFVYFLVCCRSCGPEDDEVVEEEIFDYRDLPSA